MKYPSLFLAGFCLLLTFPSALAFDRVELSKKIVERYDMNLGDAVDLDNKYGKIYVHTWEKSEMTAEIIVRAWGSSERRAKELLDRIEIRYGKTGNTVRFETVIRPAEDIFVNASRGFEIDYTIYMPADNALKLNNRYGDVFIDNFRGLLDTRIRYGNLRANKITGADKKIDIAYGNADVEQLESGTFEIAYGNGRIRRGNHLTVNSRYAKMTYENIGELHTQTKYGGIFIENRAETLIGNIAYSDVRVHRIEKQARINARYIGNFDIEEVGKDFEEISLDGAYASFTVYLSDTDNFHFALSASYGGIRSDLTEAEISRNIRQSRTHLLEGRKGKAGGKVRITTKYGNICIR